MEVGQCGLRRKAEAPPMQQRKKETATAWSKASATQRACRYVLVKFAEDYTCDGTTAASNNRNF